MIRSDGPPPPPPPPPPLFSTSSWSTLSPLAPPFTVDRAASINPSSLPPPPPAAPGFYSHPHPPGPTFSPSDPASRRFREVPDWHSFLSTPSSSLAEAAPYYPRRGTAGGTFEPLPDSLGCTGVGDSSWSRSFDDKKGDGVTCTDPSPVSEFLAFKQGTTAEGFVECEGAWGSWRGTLADSLREKNQLVPECSNLFDDKHSPVPQENISASCSKFGKLISGSNASQNRPSYFPSLDTISMMEERTSPYEKYIANLVSSSTDPLVYYSNTYLAEAYVPSAKKTGLSMDYSIETDGYSSSRNANLYNVHHDYAYHIPTETKEFSINQKSETEVGRVDRSIEGMEANNGASMGSSLTANGLFSTTQLNSTKLLSEIRNDKDYLTENVSGLGTTHLNLPHMLFSEYASVKWDDDTHTSLDTVNPLEQANVAVDSPCWKGAPAAQPSSVHNIVHYNNQFVQGQNHLPVYILNAISSPAQTESSICTGRGNNSKFSSLAEFTPSVSLISKIEKFQDVKERGSNCAKFVNEEGCKSLDVCREQSTAVLKYQKRGSEPFEAKFSNLEDGIGSPGQSTLACETTPENGFQISAQGNSSDRGNHVLSLSTSAVACPQDIVEPLTSSNSTDNSTDFGKGIHPIVKEMHDLSEMLFCTYHEDADKLADEHVLLQRVLDNLRALLIRNEKGATKNVSLVSGLEAAQSQSTVLNPDTDARQSNNQTSQSMKGSERFIRSNMCNDELDISMSEGFTKDFVRPDDIAQALEESLNEREENPQTRLYKKLWIEAEAAVCSLKYELKLAQLKLELGNNGNQAKDVGKDPIQMEVLSGQNSMCFLREHDLPRYKYDSGLYRSTSSLGDGADDSNHQRPQEANTKSNEDDASVMARFRILKSRNDILSSRNAEDCQKPQEANTKSNEDDASFMTRFRCPKNREDVLSSSKAEEDENPQGANTKLNADHASVMARFRVLKSRSDMLSCENPGDQHKIAPGSSHVEIENDIRLKALQPKLAYVGITERNPKPGTEADPGRGSSLGKTRDTSQHLGFNYNEGFGLSSKNPEHEIIRESQNYIAESQVNHSLVPSSKGKHVVSGGYDSSSSEWEHVMEEEFTWNTNS